MLLPTTPLYSIDQTRQQPCCQAESVPLFIFTALFNNYYVWISCSALKLGDGHVVSMSLHLTSKGERKTWYEPIAASCQPVNLHAPAVLLTHCAGCCFIGAHEAKPTAKCSFSFEKWDLWTNMNNHRQSLRYATSISDAYSWIKSSSRYLKVYFYCFYGVIKP